MPRKNFFDEEKYFTLLKEIGKGRQKTEEIYPLIYHTGLTSKKEKEGAQKKVSRLFRELERHWITKESNEKFQFNRKKYYIYWYGLEVRFREYLRKKYLLSHAFEMQLKGFGKSRQMYTGINTDREMKEDAKKAIQETLKYMYRLRHFIQKTFEKDEKINKLKTFNQFFEYLFLKGVSSLTNSFGYNPKKGEVTLKKNNDEIETSLALQFFTIFIFYKEVELFLPLDNQQKTNQ